MFLSLLTKYKLRLAYKGSRFSGSQFQPGRVTIEGELRLALCVLHKEEIKTTFAGRTDSGVHAGGQTVSYSTSTFVPIAGLKLGLNSLLPKDIRVLAVETVSPEFSARRHAVSREYMYSFSSDEMPISLFDWVAYVPFKVDMFLLNSMAKLVVGTHNFSAFKNLGSEDRSDVKTILSCDVREVVLQDSFAWGYSPTVFQVHFVGHSFLYRMVRNLMGAMFEVLKKKQSVEKFYEMLNNACRAYSYSAAEAKGLSLINVNYR